MATLQISMFGRFDVRYKQQSVSGLGALKVQELLCYLLVFRNRPHSREVLAELLWGDQVSGEPKKYLRKTLWQLQAALAPLTAAFGIQLVQTDGDWIQYNTNSNCWLDIDVFERAFAHCESIHGMIMSREEIKCLEQAVNLYTGALLDGWSHDWSLFERERYQYMYLAMLDKLMDYHEAQEECETGIRFGLQLLRCEPTHEPTHRRLMRLYDLIGNRAAALRQYRQCVVVLEKELDVIPDRRTKELFAKICSSEGTLLHSDEDANIHKLYCHLRQLEVTLAHTQSLIGDGIRALENKLQQEP